MASDFQEALPPENRLPAEFTYNYVSYIPKPLRNEYARCLKGKHTNKYAHRQMVQSLLGIKSITQCRRDDG